MATAGYTFLEGAILFPTDGQYLREMPKRQLDHSDILILNILQNEGDISNKDLAKRLGIAPATTLKRVLRLKSLNLLPSCHYILNKELAGYREVFLIKVSMVNQPGAISELESYLLKDHLVEQLWNISKPDAVKSIQYRALIRAQSEETFNDWCSRLLEKHNCLIEHEKAEIVVKERSSLKITYKDLMHLRSLENGDAS